eukprot:7660583-Pyramimonas_sp.AAC.1
MVKRDLERAIIEERALYRGACCTCPEFADRRPGCPVRRPSRSPHFKRTPWAWSHGNGRGHCTDPNAAPYGEQLTENDYEQATVIEICKSSQIWKHLSPLHDLK